MRRTTFQRWLDRRTTLVAFGVLGVAVFLPPTGLGISVCWANRLTGIPCPGCGMMRSLSCAVRGMLEASFMHHPFGMPILLSSMLVVFVALLPSRRRAALEAWVGRHERVASKVSLLFLGAFVGFGAIRALVHFERLHL